MARKASLVEVNRSSTANALAGLGTWAYPTARRLFALHADLSPNLIAAQALCYVSHCRQVRMMPVTYGYFLVSPGTPIYFGFTNRILENTPFYAI